MHDILTPSTDCGSSEHAPIFPYRPSLKNAENVRPACNGKAIPVNWRARLHRLRSLRAIARIIVAVAPFMCQIDRLDSLRVERARTRPRRITEIHRSVRRIHRGSIRLALPSRRAGSVL